MKKLENRISKKRLLMQYFRLIPAKLGLINKATFALQIKKIYPDDIFLLSYPKSGNTWMRFIIAYMKEGTKKNISFNEIDKIIPGVHNHISKAYIDTLTKNRIIKTHSPFFNEYPRIIYIYRDYRDVLVSFYHYSKALNEYNKSFSEFIRTDNIINKFGKWKDHLKGAIECHEKTPGKILMASYENMTVNPREVEMQVAAFCHFNTEINYSELEEKTNFHNLKANEEQNGSWFSEKSGKSFIRDGKTGGWKNIFSETDLEHLYADKELVDIMRRLGYNTDI